MKITKRGYQILYAVRTVQHETQRVVDGPAMLTFFHKSALDPEAATVSVEGLHQSATALARKGLLRKYRSTPVSYEITPEGVAELANRIDHQGRPL